MAAEKPRGPVRPGAAPPQPAVSQHGRGLALRARAAVVAALVGGLVVAASIAYGSRTVDDPPLPRPEQYPLVGVQFHGTWSSYTNPQREQLLDNLVAMGVRTVRIGVSWAMIQPDRPSGDDHGWSWTWGVPRVDSVVQMALDRGLVVHATFGRTPAWANNGAGEAAAPADLTDWQRAVRFVATRYRDKISSWEIWNEPNLPTYFVDGTPAAYTRLLCAAYPVIREAVPTTPVVYGGLSGNDWRFLRASYQVGAKGCFDVLAVHPYQRYGYAPGAQPPDDQPWYFANIELVRDVQEEFDDLKPVWFTELGWSTHLNEPETPEYQRGVSAQTQASFLVRTLQLTKARYPYVARIFIYQARDETEFDRENNNFGLFTVSLQPKPAVSALETYLLRN